MFRTKSLFTGDWKGSRKQGAEWRHDRFPIQKPLQLFLPARRGAGCFLLHISTGTQLSRRKYGIDFFLLSPSPHPFIWVSFDDETFCERGKGGRRVEVGFEVLFWGKNTLWVCVCRCSGLEYLCTRSGGIRYIMVLRENCTSFRRFSLLFCPPSPT